MVWIFGAAASLGFLWLVAPTIRTLFRRNFEPTWSNDAIVFQAQQSSHP
jgi:hypothetical protein